MKLLSAPYDLKSRCYYWLSVSQGGRPPRTYSMNVWTHSPRSQVYGTDRSAIVHISRSQFANPLVVGLYKLYVASYAMRSKRRRSSLVSTGSQDCGGSSHGCISFFGS